MWAPVSLCLCTARENIERVSERERVKEFSWKFAKQYCPVAAAERFFGSHSVLKSTVSLPFKAIMNQLS